MHNFKKSDIKISLARKHPEYVTGYSLQGIRKKKYILVKSVIFAENLFIQIRMKRFNDPGYHLIAF